MLQSDLSLSIKQLDNTEHKCHYSAHINSVLIQFSSIVVAKLKRLNSAISSFKGGNSVIIQLKLC